MKQPKRRVSVTLDVDLFEKVKILAENDERSLSRYINKIVKEHVSAKKDDGGIMDFPL